MSDKNNNKNNNSSKNKPEDLDNKINNILKKDTSPMFNMFRNNSLNSFNSTTPKPVTGDKSNKPSMEKITMNSHKKFTGNNFKPHGTISNTNNNTGSKNTYINSLEKIIKKDVVFEKKIFNNSINGFNTQSEAPRNPYNSSRNGGYNRQDSAMGYRKPPYDNPSNTPEKVEKKHNNEYKEVLEKFVVHKTNDKEAKNEYASILAATGFYKEENLDKDKNRVQSMMKSIQEQMPVKKTEEEKINDNKQKGPMVKTIASKEEFFYRKSSSNKGKKVINTNFPQLTIGQQLSPKDLALKLNITTKNLFITLKKHHLENLMKQAKISVEDLIIMAETLDIDYKILDNFDTFVGQQFSNYNKELPGSPVIAIVGHIDHGKTSLIEKLTSQNLCSKESGSITQKIANYSIKYQDRYIRLIDTPGHSVFKNARNLAIEICDFVILIVSAVEGIQPQTIDSIKFLQEYNIPFITVVTKIDMNRKYEEVYQKLMQYNIIPTFMGGEADVMAVSSKTGENIEDLMNHIVNMSDLYNLTSDTEKAGWGYVLESWKGKMGIKASILLKNGSIKNGDTIFFNDNQSMKIKSLFVNQNKVTEANLYETVEIEGLEDYVDSNEKFWIVNDKKMLTTMEDLWEKQWALDNPEVIVVKEKKGKKPRRQHRFTNEKNMPMTKNPEQNKEEKAAEKEMKILIATRSYNDINAIKECLQNLNADNKIGPFKILNATLGAPNAIDIEMLASLKGCLIAFNIDIPANIISDLKNRNIPSFYSNVIYDIVTELEEYYNNQFNSEDVLEEAGEAEIVAIFKIQKKFIAGCIVRKGLMIRNQKIQLVRDGKIVQEGVIDTLKHEANDIKEAKNNQECGIYVPAITEKYQLKDRLVCWRTKRIVRTQDGKIISEKYV